MNKLKQQFSQIRSTMPKHIQWLLLAAAFIVVLILLMLVLTGRGNKATNISDLEDAHVSLVFDDTPIDWANTTVGEKKTATIKINATAPARVDVRTNKEVDGFKPSHTCRGEVNETIHCTIKLEYAPKTAAETVDLPLYIDYRGKDEDASMNSTERVMITLGAVAPKIEPKVEPKPTPKAEPAPEPKPEPKIEPKIEPAPKAEYDEPVFTPSPVSTQIQREIEVIAPADPFAKNSIFDAADDDAPSDTYVPAPEKCSDFAFPGYNPNGMQIGWIKPESGAYYFHPFSDKDCNNPTGVYNPDTGIITDINNAGKKIGTDAEHIGRTIISGDGKLPDLADSPRSAARAAAYASDGGASSSGPFQHIVLKPTAQPDTIFTSSDPNVVVSTVPHDRTFLLRQYKPIPATIVSDVRADVVIGQNPDSINFPVRATVDRNVYADNGRTVIIPTGTLLLGYVTGKVPGPYKAIGRMEIRWYQFILPNGVEFNFHGDENDPFSGDSQGRVGVPGRGSTDYLEQFVMPMLTAIVPAAVNMIAPVADKFVNQIDLDNNTVVQSGTVRSSELAKNEIITAWNQIAQKLMVDMMDNTVPPFTIPAGTRITVYSPVDLMVTCGTDNGKACAVAKYGDESHVSWGQLNKRAYAEYEDGTWVGQVRSFDWARFCDENGKVKNAQEVYAAGLDYRNVLFYCQSNQYQAINNARQDAMYQAQQNVYKQKYEVQQSGDGIWGNGSNGSSLTGLSGNDAYNQEVLGMEKTEDGYWQLPVEQAPAAEEAVLTCLDGSLPDANGCCAGEEYTDMGEQGFNCCPVAGGDCFPPIL